MEGNQDSSESEIRIKEPGFLLTIAIRNPSSTCPVIESGIHSVKSSIQNCLRLPYMERFVMVMGLSGVRFME